MDITTLAHQLRESVTMALGYNERASRDQVATMTRNHIESLPRGTRKELTPEQKEELVDSVCNDILGLGPLQELMQDDEVTEIMVTGPHAVYIERGGRKVLSDCRFKDAGHVRTIVERMMMDSGRRLDESVPYCDFAYTDGSRVHVIIPPLAVGCAQVTIRKFLDTIQDVQDLVRFGTLDERMAEFLVACMQAKRNLLFSGATGCGKTTTLAALSTYISPGERVVTIEDTLELNLNQAHVVPLLTRPPNIEGTGEVTLRDLLRNSLRMRPSRILLGEIRGSEAMDYLQAVNSGHRGCSAVLHAASPADALRRVETLSLYAGLNLPASAIRRQIASGIDLIIQQDQLHDGSRKVTHISEIRGIEDDEILVQDLFRYELESTDEAGRAHGRFVALDAPADLAAYARVGIELSADLFSPDA